MSIKVLMSISTFMLCAKTSFAQNTFDSLNIKQPKHYFQSTIFLDNYKTTNKKIIDTTKYLSRKLKSYSIKQFNLGFFTPIKTVQEFNSDSTAYKNTHYLLTGQLLSLQPKFEGIKTHQLIKLGIGLRIIHNTGKKGLWFIDISPFITKDDTYKENNGYLRFSNSFIYSHNFSYKFNLRVGITKSFLWGNRNYLPYIGFRYGALDRINISIQIPKSININFPINNKVHLNVYTKPQGGMFVFSNKDSLYYFNTEAKFFNFTRYEILTGFRIDVSFTDNFAFYAALGTSTRNNITFYSESANANKPNTPYRKYFYELNLASTGFFNIGFAWRFGKTKSYFENRNIYDAIDLNNTIGVGDNNISPGRQAIPINKTIKQSKLNLEDIQDLIDANEY